MKITIANINTTANFTMTGRQFCIKTTNDRESVNNLWKVNIVIHTMQVVCGKVFTGNHLILNELVTTLTELRAIAAPAIIGLRKPNAANGIPMELYTKAQNRF